ncbi:hypothetical protein NPIL_165871 [Nephila pilipes]|uniref:Uncharacterized protein n=1 Tax=Nephila pilipes TaxID=299642 RepID=A0A8X6R0T8_NEPPI|nr:hypothetical protein NPIL_165871 [Nephila pilipes]
MDTTEEDKNTERCFQRALKEKQYSELLSNYLKHKVYKSNTPARKDNVQKRQELDDKIRKDLIMKIELEEDLKRIICPKHCDSHQIANEIDEEICPRFEKLMPNYTNSGTKIKASDREGFKSPTKNSKQIRKEKFKIPTSNQFEVLTKEKEDEPAPTLTTEKEKLHQ